MMPAAAKPAACENLLASNRLNKSITNSAKMSEDALKQQNRVRATGESTFLILIGELALATWHWGYGQLGDAVFAIWCGGPRIIWFGQPAERIGCMWIDTHPRAAQSHLTGPEPVRGVAALWKTVSLRMLAVAGIACAGCHCTQPHQAAAIRVPGTGMVVGRTWGTLPPVTVRNARSWQPMQAVFLSGSVRHNPVYLKDLDHNARFSGNASGYCETSQQELVGLADIPWFYINLAVCPIMMLKRPPLIMETSAPTDYRPIYNGQISAKIDSVSQKPPILLGTKRDAVGGKSGENVKK